MGPHCIERCEQRKLCSVIPPLRLPFLKWPRLISASRRSSLLPCALLKIHLCEPGAFKSSFSVARFDLFKLHEEVSKELIFNISNAWCDFTQGDESWSSKLQMTNLNILILNASSVYGTIWALLVRLLACECTQMFPVLLHPILF